MCTCRASYLSHQWAWHVDIRPRSSQHAYTPKLSIWTNNQTLKVLHFVCIIKVISVLAVLRFFHNTYFTGVQDVLWGYWRSFWRRHWWRGFIGGKERHREGSLFSRLCVMKLESVVRYWCFWGVLFENHLESYNVVHMRSLYWWYCVEQVQSCSSLC